MSGPIRLPVSYPIGFFKSSEDLFGKFNSQGDKWQMDIYNNAPNKTLFINPAAQMGKPADAKDKKAIVTNILRYDHMDGDEGAKAELQVNTDELWSSTLAYYFQASGDSHRILATYGYATRNTDGLRRVELGSSKTGDFKKVPFKLGYRITNKNFQAAAQCDQNKIWNADGIFSFDGKKGAVGFKVNPGKKGIDFELGVGYAMDDFRGYVKCAYQTLPDGGAKKLATFLFHPAQQIAGVSAVAKAEVLNMAFNNAGATFSAALCKGWDWKFGLRYNNEKKTTGANFALVTHKGEELPGKWTMGVSLGFDNVKNLDTNTMKLGLRLLSGSTPLPL